MHRICTLLLVGIVTWIIAEVLVNCFSNAHNAILYEQNERHTKRWLREMERGKL